MNPKRHLSYKVRPGGPSANTEELLFLCCRTELDDALADKARMVLRKGIDWDLFKECALRSGLPFVFYSSLKRVDAPALIPEGLINSLKLAYLHGVPGSTILYRNTIAILKLFNKKGVPAIPLKGPILSRRLYGDIASRGSSADIDLLVDMEDKDKAEAVLREAGYAFSAQGSTTGKDDLWQHIFNKPGGSMIDLHWSIRPEHPFTGYTKMFREDAKAREADGALYYELSDEDLLLQLSAHFIGGYQMFQLRYIADINELLAKSRNTMDWDLLIKKAAACKLSAATYGMLVLSKRLLGSDIPEVALKKLKPGIVKRGMMNMVFSDRRYFLHGRHKKDGFNGRFAGYFLFPFLHAQSPGDYLKLLFPERDRMKNGDNHVKRIVRNVSRLAGVGHR